MPHVLALDLGTSSVRAQLFTGDGRVLATTRAPLGIALPAPDRVEQDPEAIAALTGRVLGGALEEARVSPSDVGALGLVAQRGGALAWDAVDGTPLAPLLGWQDRRTRGRVAELRALGLPATTQAAALRFEWLLAEHDAVRAAAARGTLRLGTPDVWLSWVLSGGEAFVTDPSNAAATGLFIAGGDDWFEPALELFGIERDWLPTVVASDEVIGVVAPGLPAAGVPLAARAGDQQASCVALGVAAAGDAKLTLGTSAMLDVCTGPDVGEAPPGCHALPLWRRQARHATPRVANVLEGSVITAGASVDWLVRLCALAAPAQLDALVREAAPDHGVSVVPALAGLGAPHDDGAVRGRIDGLGLESGPAELADGLVDGLAHRCADLVEALAPQGELRIDGGLAASDALLARIADHAGVTVAVAEALEGTARGAAMLAADGAGLDALPEARIARRVEAEASDAVRAERRGAWQARIARLAH